MLAYYVKCEHGEAGRGNKYIIQQYMYTDTDMYTLYNSWLNRYTWHILGIIIILSKSFAHGLRWVSVKLDIDISFCKHIQFSSIVHMFHFRLFISVCSLLYCYVPNDIRHSYSFCSMSTPCVYLSVTPLADVSLKSPCTCMRTVLQTFVSHSIHFDYCSPPHLNPFGQGCKVSVT